MEDQCRILVTSPGRHRDYTQQDLIQFVVFSLGGMCAHIFPHSFPVFAFTFSLSSYLISFFILSSRQNPVPEKSCARCGHEAAAFYRRLLQGKDSLTVNILQFHDLTLGNVPRHVQSQGSKPICSVHML